MLLAVNLTDKKTFRQGIGIYRNSGIQSMERNERSQRWAPLLLTV